MADASVQGSICSGPIDENRSPDPATMRIGGFVPFTSIDYPGELAAVVFCQGCPWRCSYCHNPHLLDARSTELLDWQALLEVLSLRKGLLDAVVFSGGEPTLQDALPGAITEVKKMGFKVGLHPGGCYPDRLEQLLPLIDWVGLDIKDLPEHYPALTGTPGSGERAWKSLELLQASGVPFEVRTTCYPELPAARLEQLTSRLEGLGIVHHNLQEYRPV